MINKLTFCKVVTQIRALAKFNNELVGVLNIEEDKLDDIINMLSQALEEDTCAAWDDELFEDLYN